MRVRCARSVFGSSRGLAAAWSEPARRRPEPSPAAHDSALTEGIGFGKRD